MGIHRATDSFASAFKVSSFLPTCPNKVVYRRGLQGTMLKMKELVDEESDIEYTSWLD